MTILDQFVKDLHATHQVFARAYMTATPDHADKPQTEPVFFIIAVPKGVTIGPGLVHSMGGDVVASIAEATRA